MKRLILIVSLAVALTPLLNSVQAATHVGRADGEVRKIEKDTGKITLRHGPIQGMDMPGMTMVFQVKQPSMLDGLSVGDRVKFEAEKAGGAMTVTKIERAN